MKKSAKKFEYKIYPGAGHAFFNDTGDRYNATAAKDAWATSLAFLKKYLV
jgi:carboxymethylenebutenolidase